MEQASIGPYRVVERLGTGGMGEVFLAVDTRLDRKVALKYLSDPSLDMPHARERLLCEARAAAQITHPNIAAIYDILETGEHPCIVMEYAQGETLSVLASRGAVPCAQAVNIGLQLADALARAHAAGVIHRDLKPANVVLTPDGVVKVLDFGVARLYSTGQDQAVADAATRVSTHTQLSGMAGTPTYMAPEQLAGHPASTLSDIYSLGATLFELLTGRRPFEGATTADIVYQVLSRPTPLVSACNGLVPAQVTAIVAKAMAKERVERYLSAEQLRDDLRVAAADCAQDPGGRPSRGHVTASVADAVAAASRRRGLVALAGAVLLGAAVLAGVYRVWGMKPMVPATAQKPPFVAVLPFANDTGDAGLSPDVSGWADGIAATLEGLSTVKVLSRPDTAYYITATDGAGARTPLSANVRRRAQQLDVSAIVSGAVRHTASGWRVTIAMARPDGTALLSRQYAAASNGTRTALGNAIRDVIDALKVSLTDQDAKRAQLAPACQPDTFGAINQGRALLEREDVGGNAVRAEQVFTSAVSRDPSCAMAFAGLADACWARYRDEKLEASFTQATKAIERARELDPDSPTMQMSLASHYLNQKKLEAAEGTIRDVIRRRSDDDEPHRIYAGILEEMGRTEEAAAELEIAIRARPDNMLNYLARGVLQLNRQRFTDAAATFQQVLVRQPDNRWATLDLIAALAYAGEFAQALTVFESSPVKEKDPTIRANIASVYLILQKCGEAEALLREAILQAPNDHVKRRNLGDALACLGRPLEARAQYELAAQLSLNDLHVKFDPLVLAKHAVYDAKLGRIPEALQHVTEATAKSPDSSEVLYRRAVVHALAKQSIDAVEWLRRALDAGYSKPFARVDTDLASIRSLPDVQRMLDGSR